MPLIKHEKISEELEIGIWKQEESEEWFLDNLDLSESEKLSLAKYYGPKRCEWLSSRYLLHHMSGREVRGKVLKDTFGKPHLEDSNWHISLSHSADYAAVIASSYYVGIDIQLIVPKIKSLAQRFMSRDELRELNGTNDLEAMHIYWGGKESLYKLYGKGKLDFRNNLRISKFNYHGEGKISGRIETELFNVKCDLFYEEINGYMLVYAVSPY